jgi:REP element-mobilizing transposase RayT
MSESSTLPRRRTIRFQKFDYSQAACYFVTVCAREKRRIFGEVIGAEMQLNDLGKIVEECLLAVPRHFRNAEIPVHSIMPNHSHAIVVLRVKESKAGPAKPSVHAEARCTNDGFNSDHRSFLQIRCDADRANGAAKTNVRCMAKELFRAGNPQRRGISQDLAMHLREPRALGFRSGKSAETSFNQHPSPSSTVGARHAVPERAASKRAPSSEHAASMLFNRVTEKIGCGRSTRDEWADPAKFLCRARDAVPILC